jgi:SAM-dependent methyltransferase
MVSEWGGHVTPAGSLATPRSWKALVPWWLKVPAKIALASLPVPYWFWKRMGLFGHGAMDDGAYALAVFRRHYDAVRPPAGFHCLELGPGDSLATALVARQHGAARTWLVDTGPYASTDAAMYRRIRWLLESRGMSAPPEFETFEEMLAATSATYLTTGVKALKAIPDASVDLVFSHAVLEHIRLAELDELLRELRRVVRPSGAMTHQIDFKDHLAESLNSLRFPKTWWESGAVGRSGLYTNRVRVTEMLRRIERVGFRIEGAERQRWEAIPLPRAALREPYRSLPEEDLLVKDVFVVARPA